MAGLGRGSGPHTPPARRATPVDRRQRAQADRDPKELINGPVAARLMSAVVAHWRSGRQAMPAV